MVDNSRQNGILLEFLFDSIPACDRRTDRQTELI